MDNFLLAKQLFDLDDFDESLKVLNECARVNPDEKQVFVLRSRILFKRQDWGGAMNDFMKVLEIDPENKEAKSGIELTKNILGFYNPDMFNP